MSKRDETNVPDPLASEAGAFAVFKSPRGAPTTPTRTSTSTSTSDTRTVETAPEQSASTATTAVAASVWGSAQGQSKSEDPPETIAQSTEASEPSVDPGSHFSPTSVLIGADLAIRFDYYQSKEKSKTGTEPSLTVVVLSALNHCYDEDLKTYREVIRQRRAKSQPVLGAGPFSGAAAGRRSDTGSRMTVQLPIRPTLEELRNIDLFRTKVGAQSRSEFIDAVLERFLSEVTKDMPRNFKSRRQLGTAR